MSLWTLWTACAGQLTSIKYRKWQMSELLRDAILAGRNLKSISLLQTLWLTQNGTYLLFILFVITVFVLVPGISQANERCVHNGSLTKKNWVIIPNTNS